MRFAVPSILLLLAACAPAVARTDSPLAASEEVRVVQAHVDAFNRRDIDAFMATHAPDAIHWEFPDDTVWNGAPRIRAYYTELFAEPAAHGMHLDVRDRVVKGRFVIDHAEYRGLPGEGAHVSVVIYEVTGGRITNVWFMN